ncbi:replication/maintenance protein RepL [Paenibacillus aceris]|uniref:Plasmid replication protein RepL domain-containing protein n=1 Tax=Paenibacillus aceris TaxID=869555 RepID=A0ABS4I885_9BACL|nr:replication/maintenance protein RepL [Paenibacillus aceris]MBP1967142.1 hypothetical protein [Paenibacillus aceris]NHW35546.1 hypothetical protein [Paenibacillus aceris]
MVRKREGKYIIDDDGEIVGVVKQDRFVKSMTEVWRFVKRSNLFKPAEERVLYHLSHFLQMNTNALVTTHGEYMTVERMADETGIDRSNIRKVVKELMRKNALGRWCSAEREIYYINPFLFQNGDVPAHLFWLFDNEYHERVKQEHLERFKAGKKRNSLIAT